MKFNTIARKPLFITFVVFLLYFAVAIALQWVGGAYTSELGEHADEAAHYVTGLMVRDYIGSLASLDLQSPIRYAREYYQHYPKVGLGHWPPGFYLAQAAWMLILPPSRVTVMLLLGAMGAILGALVFHVSRKEFPTVVALVAGLMVVADPLVQAFSREVMSELMTATVVFAAVACYARYLETEKGGYSVAFGGLAALAALTKGTGFVLAGIPALSLLLIRRFGFLLKPSFWAAAIVVVLLVGPWYYLAPGATHEAAVAKGSMVRAPENLGDTWYSAYLVIAGIAVIPFLVIGIFNRVLVPLIRRQRIGNIWAVAAALVISMVAMRAMVNPARPTRHLLNILPAVVLFTVAGVMWVLSLKPLRRVPAGWRAAAAAIILAVLFASDYRHLRAKEFTGFSPVAQQIVSNSQFDKSVLLVSSDSSGEGMFISELATRDRDRPAHVVLRGSKIISSATWFGSNALMLFNTPEELNRFLTSVPIGIIVFDTDPPRPPLHHSLLARTVRGNPEQWQLVGTFPQMRGASTKRGPIQLYRLIGHEGKAVKNIPSQLRRDMAGD